MKAKSQLDVLPKRDTMKVGKETKIDGDIGPMDDANGENINAETQNAVLESSAFGDTIEHHKMTHASDHFFPPSSQDQSVMKQIDDANIQLQKISIGDSEMKKITKSPSFSKIDGSEANTDTYQSQFN